MKNDTEIKKQELENKFFKLQSSASRNLYQLLKANCKLDIDSQITFDVEELFDLIGETKRQDKKNVLQKAVDAINKKTNLSVRFKLIKNDIKRNKYKDVIFSVLESDEYYNYKNFWLKGKEVHEIIYNDMEYNEFENTIEYLGMLKNQNNDYYTFLQTGDKSDYDIIKSLKYLSDKTIDEEIKNDYIEYMREKGDPDIELIVCFDDMFK